MLTTVLVPLDGSLLAERALPTAVSLVKQRHGRLELLFVHETAAFDGLPDAPWHAMSESMQHRYLTDKAQQLAESCGSEVGHALTHGDIAASVCAHAKAVGAQLIVMSSHGRTGWNRAVAGSVADAVIRQSCLPVLLLRESAAGGAPRAMANGYRRILVPLDESEASREIFDAASAVAIPGLTEFLLLHVVPPVRMVLDATVPYAYAAGPIDPEATQHTVAAANRELADAAAELARRSACEVDPYVIVADHAATAIIDVARRRGPDLIAMTTRGRGASRLVFGSVVDGVIRGCELPLLLQRPKPH